MKLICQNSRAKINQNFMNILKSYPGWESVTNVFMFTFFFVRKMNKGQRNGKLLSNMTKNSNDIGTFFNINDAVFLLQRQYTESNSVSRRTLTVLMKLSRTFKDLSRFKLPKKGTFILSRKNRLSCKKKCTSIKDKNWILQNILSNYLMKLSTIFCENRIQ